jgi:hypothetical protein
MKSSHRGLVCLGLFIVNEAHADLKYIPKWTYDPTKGQACYGFEDAKKLMLLDSQLELCAGRDAAQNNAITALQTSNDQYKLAVDSLMKQLGDEKAFSADLGSKLKKSTEEREAYAAQARMAWTVVGVLTAIGAGVGFGVWLDRR